MEPEFSCRNLPPWNTLKSVRFREGAGRRKPKQFLEIPFEERDREAIPELYFELLRDCGAVSMFPRIGMADDDHFLEMQEVELVFAETTRSIRLWTFLDVKNDELDEEVVWWPRQLMLATRALFQGKPLTHPFPLPEVPAALERIAFAQPGFPSEAIEAVMASPDTCRQPLLDVLRWVLDLRPEHYYRVSGKYLLHIYALELLSYWKDPDVKPLVLQLTRLPEAHIEMLFNDFWTEMIPGWLEHAGSDNPEELAGVVCERTADPWGRAGSIDVLRHLYLTQRLECETYKSMLDRALMTLEEEVQKPEKETHYIWAELAFAATEFPEFHPKVREALQRGWIDERVISLNEYRALMEGRDQLESPMIRPPSPLGNFESSYCYSDNYHLLREDRNYEVEALDYLDVVMGGRELAGDEEGEREGFPFDKPDEDGFEPGLSDPGLGGTPHPYRREAPKVGRNDPCPCGSGKKYKKCCGENL